MPKSRGEELDELFEASIAQAVEGIGKRWPELAQKEYPCNTCSIRKHCGNREIHECEKLRNYQQSGSRYLAYKDLIRKVVTSVNGIEFMLQIFEIPNQLYHNVIPGSIVDGMID